VEDSNHGHSSIWSKTREAAKDRRAREKGRGHETTEHTLSGAGLVAGYKGDVKGGRSY
jgi:hypothetical protein